MISSWIVKVKVLLKLMCFPIVFTISLMSLSFLKQARNGSLRFEMVNGILNWTVIRIKWTLDMNSFITLTSQCCVFVYWSKCWNEKSLCLIRKKVDADIMYTGLELPNSPCRYYVNWGNPHPPYLLYFLPLSSSLLAGEIKTSRISIIQIYLCFNITVWLQ